MAKKLAVVMAILSVGLAAFVVNLKMNEDGEGPEISFTDSELAYVDSMTDEELLADVVAMDEKEGDVSSSLAIENVHVVSEEEVIVVYVAKDSSNNISKAKRTLKAEAEKEEIPEEDLAEETEYAEVTEELPEEDADTAESEEQSTVLNFDELAGTDSEEDSTLTEEAAADDVATVSEDGKSEADLAREEQEALADNMPAGSPRLYLTDYWIEVPVGTTIDAISYVKNIEDDVENFFDLSKKIQIYDANGSQPGVSINFPAAGTYTYTYYVVDNQSHTSNTAKLIVVAK